MKVALVVACLAVLAAPAVAQTPDVVGAWNVVVNVPQGTVPALLTLKKDGDRLGGQIVSDQGEFPVEASLKDHALTLTFTYDAGGDVLAITMVGTLENGALKGTIDMGAGGSGDWTAQRAEAPKGTRPLDAPTIAPPPSTVAHAADLDVTGTWAFSVTTANQSGSPTITLKQAGERLTGQYNGQYGQAPLEGTIEGAKLHFEFDIEIEGTALHVVYDGTAEKDGLKGTVNYGDVAQGTFTAARKN